VPLHRPKRKSVILAAAACAGVLAVVLTVTGFGGGSGGDVTYLDGTTSAFMYNAGHQPLAPNFSAAMLTGTPLSFSSYRGKVVVLNFWGSWCTACREEAPTLSVLAEQERGVSFLGVDLQDTTANAMAFIKNHDVDYPSVGDPSGTITLRFSSVVPINVTPTTLVIDRTGHIAGAVFGAVTYSELTAMLAKVTGKS
jgi:thiol-disulfide isomerase/thioredoxin